MADAGLAEMSLPHRQTHADLRYRHAAGVVHGLEFVVAYERLPGEGIGGGLAPR